MIRWMLKDDLDAVAELEQLSFSIPWSYENLEQGLSNGLDQYLVWEENGMAAGYINFRILAGEGEIERVAVHPLLRGRGFGRKLMEAMVEYASGQGVRDITLSLAALPLACSTKRSPWGTGASSMMMKRSSLFSHARTAGKYAGISFKVQKRASSIFLRPGPATSLFQTKRKLAFRPA